MKRLLLFDIDGTLLSKSTGHMEAFAAGFKEVFGVDGSIDMINYHGKTDQMIIREVMLKCGVTESEINEKIAACMDIMCDYFDHNNATNSAEIFPGLDNTLDKLDTENNLLGLVTGNLEPIAHGKLAIVDIDKHFRLGGYGSDAEKRSDLVKKAVKDATDQFGFDGVDNVYLFGDTPYDIKAAVDAGVISIGVTTGVYNEQELYTAGADKVIDSLGNQEAVLDALSTV